MPAMGGDFASLLEQLTDGEKWKLACGRDWDDFAARLGAVIGSLDVRRRQAIVMALVAVSTGALKPAEIHGFLLGRDLEDDDEVAAFLAWLHEHRPRFFES